MDKNNSYDVIIIGAGPGGLHCAKVLEEKSDLNILLIEKNDIIGPKICAGGITNKDIDLIGIPQEIIDCTYSEITFESPTLKTVVKRDKPFVYTVDRQKLGQWQLSKLKRTAVLTSKTVSRISSNEIALKSGERITFKYLIAADGSNSLARHYLKLGSENIGIGIQYIVPKQLFSSNDFVLRFSSKEFGEFYGWIFPHKEYASIGTGGVARKTDLKKLRRNLDNWMAELGIPISKSRFEGFTLNDNYQGNVFGSIYLVGDAAGLVSRLTGEGMYSALLSAEEVVEKILNPDYTMPRLESLLKSLNQHRMISKSIELAGPMRQKLFNGIIKKLRQDKYIDRAIRAVI